MSYETKNIRNIAFLGHGGNGKTSLAENILFLTGVTNRQGKVAEGNTVSDYDSEETRRQISIQMSVMYTNYKGKKINILDAPGYFDFVGEVHEALRAADASVIVISAKDGLDVGAEKAWELLEKEDKPRAIFISKIDEDHADFNKTVEQLKEKFGHSITPMVMPVMEGEKLIGVADIIERKAYTIEKNKQLEIKLPESISGEVEDRYSEIAENAASTCEELMEKFLDTMELSPEEIYGAMANGIKEHDICPVFCGNIMTGLGTEIFLNAVAAFFPAPMEQGEDVNVDGEPCAIVFQTITDQFGKFSIIKVYSGTLDTSVAPYNVTAEKAEKPGNVYIMRGKKNVQVDKLIAGDIGALSKLQMTATGDWEIGNAPLGDGVDWQMSYRLTDVYGGQYWTPTVKNY